MAGHLNREQLVRWRDHGMAEDRDAVVAHLAACRSCAADYAELVRTPPVTAEPVRFDPADFVTRGYAVRDEVARREAAAGSRLPAWLRMLWNPSAPLARGVMASQLALIAVLGIYIALPLRQEPTFGTRSGSSASPGGVRLTIIFQPGTTEDAMRRALIGIHGMIVSGPSAAGVYIVELSSRSDDPAVQNAIDTLRTNNAVVQFAEREP